MIVTVIDRETKEKEEEQVPCRGFLRLLYGKNLVSWLLLPLLAKSPLFSSLFGKLQSLPRSKKQIQPFINKYKIDASEFLKPVSNFSTFNDFFIRKLKPGSRPIESGSDIAVAPADGRYLAFQDLSQVDGIFAKGKMFTLEKLLQDEELSTRYKEGALVIARLAPVDYHRFHFPVSCTPLEPKLINGLLDSVNPIALKQNIEILAENKRVITQLGGTPFGTVLFLEIGATNVGSICQTFTPNKQIAKGEEKGFFSLGGSCVMLLFEPGSIHLDRDLIENTQSGCETLCKMGQSMGRRIHLHDNS